MQAQATKDMDMVKKEPKAQIQQVTYTCPMHPEIHANKPGNCPWCGMKLVKEKPKVAVKQPAVKNQDALEMKMDNIKPKAIDVQEPVTY